MSDKSSSSEIKQNPAQGRFELISAGVSALLEYDLQGDRMIIHHTYVPPELRGGGVAAQLAAAAFEFARAEGLKVVPQCSYIPVYLKRHPEYRDLAV